MARFDRLTVLNSMLGTGLVPVFFNSDLAVAKEVVAACADGGAEVVEFTNRGDRAINVFNQIGCNPPPAMLLRSIVIRLSLYLDITYEYWPQCDVVEMLPNHR